MTTNETTKHITRFPLVRRMETFGASLYALELEAQSNPHMLTTIHVKNPINRESRDQFSILEIMLPSTGGTKHPSITNARINIPHGIICPLRSARDCYGCHKRDAKGTTTSALASASASIHKSLVSLSYVHYSGFH
jgi:hypothetical protein